MIVYILAIPVFSFLIPIYAFWHFDDFSWGNTRIVVGEKGQKKAVGPEEGDFDPESIPTKSWSEYEKEIMMDEEEWEGRASSHQETVCSCEEEHHHHHSRCSSVCSSQGGEDYSVYSYTNNSNHHHDYYDERSTTHYRK